MHRNPVRIPRDPQPRQVRGKPCRQLVHAGRVDCQLRRDISPLGTNASVPGQGIEPGVDSAEPAPTLDPDRDPRSGSNLLLETVPDLLRILDRDLDVRLVPGSKTTIGPRLGGHPPGRA